MPSRRRQDDDLVPKDNPQPVANDSQLPNLPIPNLLPDWDPLAIKNDLERGKHNIPPGINRASLIELFKLFFTEEWLRNIVRFTNINATRCDDLRSSLHL